MNRYLKWLLLPVLAIPGLYLALVWNRLPEKVALHFDIKGNPDRFGNKQELVGTVLILAAVSLLVYLLLTNIYRVDPKRYAAENKDRLQRIAFAVIVFISALVCIIIYSAEHGNIRFSSGILFSATGLLFAVIGNYLPNLKPNYFMGLRLPWTLENEDNWRKTHALAGRLWFAGGLFLALACLFLPAVGAIAVFFSVMTAITLIPIIFSYRLYRDSKKQGPHNK